MVGFVGCSGVVGRRGVDRKEVCGWRERRSFRMIRRVEMKIEEGDGGGVGEREVKEGRKEAILSLSRLYSSIDPTEGNERYRPGSFWGAAALVAGTTVGAGVLALPAVTQDGGFIPSSVLLVLSWVYMATTGNLIADVTVGTMWTLGRKGVSLLSMTEYTLGKIGAIVSGSAYVFIHYALLVAYISQGGKILDDVLGSVFASVPSWNAPVLFAFSLGSLMYIGGEKTVEKVNNTLVIGLLICFGGLVATVTPNIHTENYLQIHPKEATKAVPVMILSLVFHNVIPVIAAQLDGDLKKIKAAINVGSFIPLSMFLIWNAAILGITSQDTNTFDPLEAIRNGDNNAGQIISVFSLVAISTSFFGFVYGLVDFLKDAQQRLSISQVDDSGSDLSLYASTLIPPTALAIIAPGIFFKALDTAGTYGISVLFGIIPAAMVWQLRYVKDSVLQTPFDPVVKGGRWTLSLIAGLAVTLIVTEVIEAISPMIR